MSKKQHIKTKNKSIQNKLELINYSTERRVMPRPVIFQDKSKYNRKRQAKEMKNMFASY